MACLTSHLDASYQKARWPQCMTLPIVANFFEDLMPDYHHRGDCPRFSKRLNNGHPIY